MEKKISAFTDDALGTLDATGIAEAIAKGSISAIEATEAAIARAEKVNGPLNAIVVKTYDHARHQAKSKHTGVFAGVPTFVKDNDKLKGLPTQFGTGAFKSKPAGKNSKFANQFLSTGVNYLGKTSLPEFGLICSTENPAWGITRNPWDTDFTTGGSSSGSAAMVASGVVPIATANDGAGSTRIPASCCGLIGLKPSRDRLINVEGSELMPMRIVYQGVLTRSVRDTAAFYAAAEKYYHNPKLPAVGHVIEPGKQRLRIVCFENIPVGKTGHADDDTYNATIETAKLLTDMGHFVDRVPFPINIEDMTEHFLNYYGFFAYLLTDLGRVVIGSKVNKQLIEPFTAGLSKQFKKNVLKLPQSLRILRKSGAVAEALLNDYDLIMTPVLSHKVPRIGYFSVALPYDEITRRAVDFSSFTAGQNITGSPSISIPSATSSDGLPMGMNFIAPYGNERRLLELAYELELARPWKFVYNS
jgi:amidase